MSRWMSVGVTVFFGCFILVESNAQCGFAIVPAADKHWYRAEGWPIPGLNDSKGLVKIRKANDGKPQGWDLPEGITVSWVSHDQGYKVQFPDTVFDENGFKKRMLPRSFILYEMLRWEMNGVPYAYSYDLGPLDVACTSSVDIIDDRGDGKFRLISSPGHTLAVPPGQHPEPPPVPVWLQKPQS